MPKDYFQDITPRQPSSMPQSSAPYAARDQASSHSGPERTIRNIPINPRRDHHRPADADPHAAPIVATGSAARANSFGVKKYILWVIAAVLVAAIAVFVAAAFRGTSVVVLPRTHTIVLTEDVALTAYPITDKAVAPGSLVYDLATNSYEAEQIVPANGSEDVSEYAHGVVTVYNEYSATPVRLIKNTRFETPSGLTFRVRDSVVVPGRKGENPGTITATIYADQPGDKYNIPATDRFTLPGLKNTSADMFAKVYARSVTPFAGGFVGNRPKVAEADLEKSRRALQAGLEERARQEVTQLSAPGLTIFPSLMTISFEALPPVMGEDGQVRVREKAIVTVPAFSDALFAKVLAAATRADVGDAVVNLKDISAMSVRRIATDARKTEGPIDIVVSGNATLIWEVDTDALAAALAGTPKETFETVTAGFQGIEQANAYIRPVWKQSFPAEAGDIQVILNNKALEQ